MTTATVHLIPSEEVFAAPNSNIYATAADSGDIILASGVCNVNFYGVDTGLTFISGDQGGTVTFASSGASSNTIQAGTGNLTVNFKGASHNNIIEANSRTTVNLNGGTNDLVETQAACGAIIDRMGSGGIVRMHEGSIAILTNTQSATFDLVGITQNVITAALANVPTNQPSKVIAVSIDNLTIQGTESMFHNSHFVPGN